MIKKIFIGTFLLAGILFLSTISVSADEEIKPWESMFRFRGEDKINAQELGMSKDDFYVYRNELREKHREERILQRQERLQLAFERGCISEEEMTEKMQTRRSRFLK